MRGGGVKEGVRESVKVMKEKDERGETNDHDDTGNLYFCICQRVNLNPLTFTLGDVLLNFSSLLSAVPSLYKQL